MKIAEQDGAQFYDAETHELVAEYRALVSHDFDMPGALAARTRFLVEHPDFRMITPAEASEALRARVDAL